MERVLASLGQKLYSYDDHVGYLIEWRLVAPLCKKWSRNREPDGARVDEILDYQNRGGYIPRLIHLAELDGEGLVCYDGNHRREVFNRSSGPSIVCVIDVMFGATQNDVYKAFHNINKSVVVPALYFDYPDCSDNQGVVKEAVLALVKSYETTHKVFVSTSPRYHAPHFNRDSFVDNIYNIYKSFNGSMSVEEIAKLLIALNDEYANGNMCRPHSLYKPHAIEKCKKHNFWLFLERMIPFEHLEKLAKKI